MTVYHSKSDTFLLVQACGFALAGRVTFADHIRVICPSGLLCSTNSFPMNLSLPAQRKVTKRKGTHGQFALRDPSPFVFANGPA